MQLYLFFESLLDVKIEVILYFNFLMVSEVLF